MRTVSTHEAKTHLSRLLKRVAMGEEIVITRGSKPVARLVPLKGAGARRELGFAREELRISDDFDAALPPAVIASFEDGDNA